MIASSLRGAASSGRKCAEPVIMVVAV